MKNILIISLATLTLWSCGAAEEPTEEKETNTTENTDTTAIETEVEVTEVEEEEVADFSKIEHYAIFTSKDMLIENFGAENIEDGSSWFGEGTMELQHSVLTNPSNGHIVKYVWEEENPTKLSFIEVYANVRNAQYETVSVQKIGTDCGLFTGMTIKEMKDLNGEDFSFSGFGWDFHGMVRQADDSKIASCGLSLALDLKFEEGKDEYNGLYGDIELSTADELVLNAPITLDHITLFVD